MKNEYIVKCPKCGKEYIVNCTSAAFAAGRYKRFCSRQCANSRNMTPEIKQKIADSVKNTAAKTEKPKYNYTCESCSKEFTTEHPLKKGRHIHCDECKQKRSHYKNDITSIWDVSKRTVTKILQRSNKGCSICGWNESTCDIHHVIPRSKGGNNDLTNLIVVCPNCHRVIHTSNKYSTEFLKMLTIDKTFSDWKTFYHVER